MRFTVIFAFLSSSKLAKKELESDDDDVQASHKYALNVVPPSQQPAPISDSERLLTTGDDDFCTS